MLWAAMRRIPSYLCKVRVCKYLCWPQLGLKSGMTDSGNTAGLFFCGKLWFLFSNPQSMIGAVTCYVCTVTRQKSWWNMRSVHNFLHIYYWEAIFKGEYHNNHGFYYQKELAVVEKGIILALHKLEYKISDISKISGHPWSTVKNFLNRQEIRGSTNNLPRSGRPLKPVFSTGTVAD